MVCLNDYFSTFLIISFRAAHSGITRVRGNIPCLSQMRNNCNQQSIKYVQNVVMDCIIKKKIMRLRKESKLKICTIQ